MSPPLSLAALAALVLLVSATEVHSQRLRYMMYESLYSGGACYRRLNGTHQIGCSSKLGGTVGVVHAVSGIKDVQWIIKNGTAGPYAAFLPIHLFTEKIINMVLDHSDLFAGIIVYNNKTERIASFSHEQRCPNVLSQWTQSDNMCHNSARDSDVWNPFGTGLMYRDYPFAIFYLPPEKRDDINKINDCFEKFNSFELDSQSSRSLCAIEMDAFMFAAVNSQVCIRRSSIVKNLSPVRYCDALSGRSIYTTLFPRGSYSEKVENEPGNNSTNKDNLKLIKPDLVEGPGSVALVTAAMDATTMFEGSGSGAVTTVSGLVTLLATAHALSLMIPANHAANYTKNVMFVLLNGETYDYIGSQRMAWDLASGNFPSKGSDPVPPLLPMAIGPHLHIGQLQNSQNILHAFTPNYIEIEKRITVEKFVDSMYSEGILVNDSIIRTDNIPPSSLHSFLRFLNSSTTKMASVVLTDHEKNFKNTFYQSILDNKSNLDYNYFNLSSEVKQDETDFHIKFPDSSFPSNSVQVRLASISTAITRALYEHVTGNPYNGSIKSSPFIIDELLHCYLDSIACRMVTVTQSPFSTPPPVPTTNIPPASLYVGVSSWYTTAVHATVQFAAFLTGTNMSRTKDDCKGLNNEAVFYEWAAGWFNDGVCIRSIINITQAMSPAFVEKDYDFSSGIYSTWTESVWNSISLRILVKPAHWREKLIIGVGCTIFILSIILVLLGRKHVVWLIDVHSSPNRIETVAQPTSRVDC